MLNELLVPLTVGLVVLVTHCLEGITGFGCTVLALPFIVMLLGVKTAVPVLTVLAWLLAGFIVLRSWRKIQWQEFLFIVVHVVIGLPLGILAFSHFSEGVLKLLLVAFMACVGVQGLRKALCERSQPVSAAVPAARRTLLMRAVLLLGGIVHGAFASGGPFVVIYASRALPDKTLFRVTLCLLWLALNSIMIVKWTVAGNVWNADIATNLAITLPFLGGGMLLGDFLHHRVNDDHFRVLVYAMLLASALVMAYSMLRLSPTSDIAAVANPGFLPYSHDHSFALT